MPPIASSTQASEHRFNTSAYGLGRRSSGMRELAVPGRRGFKRRAVARYRLDHWLGPSRSGFADCCRLGAGGRPRYDAIPSDEAKLKRIRLCMAGRAFARGTGTGAEAGLRRRQLPPAKRTRENWAG